MGPCPDCTDSPGCQNGRGCHRCAGTGNVRFYDDGYIGEERTRLHPKEKKGAANPKCHSCSREVAPGWKNCPHCGLKLEPPAEIELISDPMGGTNAPPEAIMKSAEDRKQDSAAEAIR